MKMNINRTKITALVVTGAMLSLVGCQKAQEKSIDNDTDYVYVESEYLDNSNEALMNVSNDYEEVLEIADLYFEARDNNDAKKLKKFYDYMRDLYLNYDETKARKASALLPYFIEAEVIFHDTEYSFTDEEMSMVDELYPQEEIINGYTIPEYEKIYHDFIDQDNYEIEDSYNISL